MSRYAHHMPPIHFCVHFFSSHRLVMIVHLSFKKKILFCSESVRAERRMEHGTGRDRSRSRRRSSSSRREFRQPRYVSTPRASTPPRPPTQPGIAEAAQALIQLLQTPSEASRNRGDVARDVDPDVRRPRGSPPRRPERSSRSPIRQREPARRPRAADDDAWWQRDRSGSAELDADATRRGQHSTRDRSASAGRHGRRGVAPKRERRSAEPTLPRREIRRETHEPPVGAAGHFGV